MVQVSRSAFVRALNLIWLIGVRIEITASKVEDAISSSPAAPPTCPARSVNYITETLPLQCLRTPWSNTIDNTRLLSEVITGHADTKLVQSGHDRVVATVVPDVDYQATTSGPTGSSEAPTVHLPKPSIGASGSSTAGEPNQPSPTEATDSDSEGESPLDNANFLSFEEWKKQNLAKAGQSADHIGHGRAAVGEGEVRRRPGSINNALDSLGEDTEIEIDFGGFVNQARETRGDPTHQDGRREETLGDADGIDKSARLGEISSSHPRGKDAGKTCKERSNYASFDCAAVVRKTNPECKGATSVLVENKDSYLLNECSAKNKFLIVELCNDILVDTVVLANFEFFSSMFRTFKVSVSDRYPVKLDKWRELGTYEARNSRQVQAFLIENPSIWARYLRIEFLTHYGNEYYCPLSLLRVHGTTMMEEFNHDVKGSRIEEDSEGETEGVEKEEGKASDVVTAENMKPQWTSTTRETPNIASSTTMQLEVSSPIGTPEILQTQMDLPPKPSAVVYSSINSLLLQQMDWVFLVNSSSISICKIEESPNAPSLASSSEKISESTINPHVQPTTALPSFAESTTITQNSHSGTGSTSSLLARMSSTITTPETSIELRDIQTNTIPTSHSALRNPSLSMRASSSSTQPPPSSPSTQESFFKSVHKRLQLLESNSTLSLQYIEEQSSILRDAFAKVEKRQLAKTSAFLDTLNTTVLNELRDFGHQYDQLWQSTILELASQRAQSEKEVIALSSRLTILADEVVFQKRIAILQFLLILVCLGLVLFSRPSSSSSTYLELPPVVQHAFNKSSSSLAKYAAQSESPPMSPSSTRPPSRYGYSSQANRGHGRGPSDGSGISDNEGSKTPNIEYSPPTPTSQNFDGIHETEVVKGEVDKELLNQNGSLGSRQIKYRDHG